jgi:hypothetical protein
MKFSSTMPEIFKTYIFKDVKREEALYSFIRNMSLVTSPHKNCTARGNIQMLPVPFIVKFLPAE